MSNRAIEDEILTLRKDISEAEKELHDVLQLNYDLMVENRNKDEIVSKYLHLLNSSHEKNELEYQQVSLEDTVIEDEINHQISIETQVLTNLKLELEKLSQLENKNRHMKDLITNTSTTLRSQSLEFSNQMHKINRNIREYRQEMESTLRKQLKRIDRSYQQNAYKTLSKSEKSDLLQVSMLQDEMTLQSIGKFNLQTRYHKQEKKYQEYCEQTLKMKSESIVMRNRLATLFNFRKRLVKILSSSSSSNSDLLKYKSFLSSQSSQHLLKDIEDHRVQLNELLVSVDKESSLLEMWSKRLLQVNELLSLGENIMVISSMTSINDLKLDVLSWKKEGYDVGIHDSFTMLSNLSIPVMKLLADMLKDYTITPKSNNKSNISLKHDHRLSNHPIGSFTDVDQNNIILDRTVLGIVRQIINIWHLTQKLLDENLTEHSINSNNNNINKNNNNMIHSLIKTTSNLSIKNSYMPHMNKVYAEHKMIETELDRLASDITLTKMESILSIQKDLEQKMRIQEDSNQDSYQISPTFQYSFLMPYDDDDQNFHLDEDQFYR